MERHIIMNPHGNPSPSTSGIPVSIRSKHIACDIIGTKFYYMIITKCNTHSDTIIYSQ